MAMSFLFSWDEKASTLKLKEWRKLFKETASTYCKWRKDQPELGSTLNQEAIRKLNTTSWPNMHNNIHSNDRITDNILRTNEITHNSTYLLQCFSTMYGKKPRNPGKKICISN